MVSSRPLVAPPGTNHVYIFSFCFRSEISRTRGPWKLIAASQGITVPGISLPGKIVTLKGMNNLKNCVKINSFDLPGNDPAGGIHLTLDTSVTNVSGQVAFLCSPFQR